MPLPLLPHIVVVLKYSMHILPLCPCHFRLKLKMEPFSKQIAMARCALCSSFAMRSLIFFCLYNEILIRNSRGVRAHAAVSVSFLSVLLIFYLYNLNQQSISRELNLEIMSNWCSDECLHHHHRHSIGIIIIYWMCLVGLADRQTGWRKIRQVEKSIRSCSCWCSQAHREHTLT